MTEPWKKYQQVPEKGPWSNFADTWSAEQEDVFGVKHGPAVERSSILPFSKDAQGRDFIDFNSGLIGSLKSGITAPGDVASGKLDPESPEAVKRAMDFATIAAPVNPAIRAGDKAIPGALKALKPTKPKAPSVEALKEASEAGYESIRAMGVDYSADAVKSLADDVARELEDKGIFAELSPKTFSLLDKLREPPADSVASIENLVAARRAFNNAAGDFTNPTERLAANRVIDRLDEFLLGRDEASVVAGPAPAAGKALEDARGNYAAAKRSEKVTGAEERADLNAAVANSGANVDNQTRARIRDLLTRKKDARGYSKEELAFLEQVARGTWGSNLARWMGNLLGGGGGMGAQVAGGLGAAFGGVAGGFPGAGIGYAIPPIVGALSKKASAALTRRQLHKADEKIRERSPLFEEMKANPPMEAINPEARAAILRALGLYGTQDEAQ